MALIRPISRRSLLRRGGFAGVGLVAGSLLPTRAFSQSGAPAVITSESIRPSLPYGVQSGDLAGDRAILWARADRPARMMVEWATTESFADARTAAGPAALEDSDLTARLDLAGLPPGQKIHYRIRFVDLADHALASVPAAGSFWTPPAARRSVRFVWSADTVGQGWGINPDWGGMRIYRAMAEVAPDFFIHSGDTIYADGPVAAEQATPDGGIWRNLTTEAKSKVAETLAEFRGAYAYNLLDENLRAFNAAVPMLAQWDDHEVTDNWYWEKRRDQDERYREKSVGLLAARGLRAFTEYLPVRRHPLERDRIYGSFRYGPAIEVFRIDMRSYRGPNTDGREMRPGPGTTILGLGQLRWLRQALLASDATWKVIAADMPLGLVVWDDFRAQTGAEAVAQGDDGSPRGRELEIAGLLRFIRDASIANVVWLTADVHYTAAHHYHPNRARFQEFAPFWEFVSGPLNAGTFGPNRLDATFGPEVVFQKTPPAGQFNLPPSAGLQFFGQVDIDGPSEVMTVRLKDLTGTTLFTQELMPVA
jgi:alkaline phosphatase D